MEKSLPHSIPEAIITGCLSLLQQLSARSLLVQEPLLPPPSTENPGKNSITEDAQENITLHATAETGKCVGLKGLVLKGWSYDQKFCSMLEGGRKGKFSVDHTYLLGQCLQPWARLWTHGLCQLLPVSESHLPIHPSHGSTCLLCGPHGAYLF